MMTKQEKCIMYDNPPYWRNRRLPGLVRHEVFFGIRNRQKSIDDGLVVFLTPEMHNMSNKGVHFNREFDLILKQEAEKIWLKENNKTKEDFIKKYGRNYL